MKNHAKGACMIMGGVALLLMLIKSYSTFAGTVIVGQTSDQSNLKEADYHDYTVYNAFFSTEKLPAIEIPQFFEHAVKARRIYSNTDVAKDSSPELTLELGKTFGGQFNSVFENYKKRNQVEYIFKDKFRVLNLSILTKAERDKKFAGQLVEVPSSLTGEYLTLSRVGFNKAHDISFFHITWNGSAVTSYYVMMQKKENRWVIINVIMDDMIIF